MAQKTDAVVEAVRADLLQRSQFGIAKYGVALERTDLTLRDWLQHAYEECLDQANYLKRTIMEVERGQRAQQAAPGKVPLEQIDRVARAIWADRVQRNAILGIDLEPWGPYGTVPRANGIFEEATAAIKAMK